MLRSIVYKSSISIPTTVLFAFDYKKPCLELRKTTSMVFSNNFAYLTIAIQLPVLAVILIDVLHEFYKWKPNATYELHCKKNWSFTEPIKKGSVDAKSF